MSKQYENLSKAGDYLVNAALTILFTPIFIALLYGTLYPFIYEDVSNLKKFIILTIVISISSALIIIYFIYKAGECLRNWNNTKGLE